MARELVINIRADGTQAKRELNAVEGEIDDVGKATQNADKGMTTFGATSTKVVTAIAGALAAAQIGDKLQKAVDATSRIADSAQQLGISAEAVQKLAFAASQGGSSLEAVATSMGRMASVLGDEKGGAKALAQVGLTFSDIKGLAPDQTFIAIADAIAKIPDPLKQADAARDLFGRGALDMLPAIKAGFQAVGDQAPLMSNAIVDAGDKAGDAMDKLATRIQATQANALVPLANMFLALPESVQSAAAGIYSFIPSLESLALAIIAAGGPTAAITGLKAAAVGLAGYLATGFAVASAAFVTFLTVTLPAAFAAVIAFLGPQGLIALGLLALLFVWTKWGEDIKRIVAGVYTAVKDWMGTKLSAVWDMVGAGLDKVTGFFGTMYDKVVGNSYVPDMITEIGQWFGKLDDVMVKPTLNAASGVVGIFGALMPSIGGLVRDGFGIVKGIASAFAGDFSGVIGGIIAGINLARAAWHGLQKLFGGGEEGVDVNPNRDKFFAQYGGYEGLATKLTAASDGNIAEQLIRNLYAADTRKLFDAAQRPIVDLIGGNTFRHGTRGQYMDFGSGSLAMLHGKERVMTEAEGTADSTRLARVEGLLEQLLRQQPRVIARAVTTALILAPRGV